MKANRKTFRGTWDGYRRDHGARFWIDAVRRYGPRWPAVPANLPPVWAREKV